MTADRAAKGRGTLFLVVGPSGVGKDSLIEGVKRRLADNPVFEFPRRYITRPADAGGEDHIQVSPAEFLSLGNSGGLALSWRAHGLSYGLPHSIENSLVAGRHVLANVSRCVIEDARRRFPPVRILSIFAAQDVVRKRLETRGRETAEDVAARVDRTVRFDTNRPDVTAIDNSGELDHAVDAMIRALLTPPVD